MFESIRSFLYFDQFKSISKNKALSICIIITAAIMVAEYVFGQIAHSLMLVSDAFHMLTHALSLALTLASRIIAHYSNNRKVEYAAVLINGITLLYFGIYIMHESYFRFLSPEPIDIAYTFSIAVVGFAVNMATAIILNQSGVEDLNTRSAFAHMIADTLSSASIILGSIIIYFTDYYIIDSILSFIVALLVIKWAIDLLRNLNQVWKPAKHSYL